MVTIQGAAAFGVFLSGAVLVGNHYYIKSSWKSNHPLVSESIQLLLRDPAVVRELGPNIIKKGSSLDGVLDSGRNWANINFEVEGTIKARVNLVADAKPASDVLESEHYTEAYEDYSSTLMTLYNYIVAEPVQEHKYRWKIANLTLTIDEWINVEIVNSTTKLHQDLIKKDKIMDVPKESLSVGTTRRKKQMDSVTHLYWKMVFGGISCLFLGIYMTKIFTHQPVVNSVLISKSLEVLKTSEVARKHIGLPVHSFQALKGYMNHNLTKGNATYFIYGPMGFARVFVSGKYDKKQKIWNFDEFLVRKDNQDFKIKV